MNTKDRLILFLAYLKMGQDKFEKSVGLSRGFVNNVGDTIRKSSLEKITAVYPQLNTAWLLTGVGQMLINGNTNENNQSNMKTESNNPSGYYTTYLLPLSAMGGSLTGFAADGVMLQNCEAIVSPIANVDFAITVYGDSMAPEYPSGSRILINKINPDIFIEWGKTFVLDTPNGVIVKEIWESNQEGYITCHSINPAPKYKDFDVPMDEIYGMYRVLMCLSAK